MQENLGLGLARDVLALLDGRVGGYAAGELRPRASEKEAFQDLETGAYVGVRDPDAARTLLEKLAAHPEVAPHVKTVDGGWEIAVPEWRTVHVRVAGAAVVAGTDVPFLDRVAAGGGGDWPASQGNPALTALFEGSTHNAAWMMDMGLMAFMVFATFRNGLPPDPPAEPAEGEPPFSAAWQEKKAALIAERKAVEEARSRLDDEEFQVARSLFSALGISAAAGGPATGGLVLEGGQFFGLEGIPAVAREVATRAFELEALSSRRRTEVWDRQNNLWRLEDELRQIREKDLEEHRRQEEAAGQAAEGAAPATDGAPAPAADVAPPPAADGGPPPATNAAEPPAAHGVER
ncbi:MAG: hypothetical protein FJ098_11430 [Deltaproteobacteria bacterium]|nr:hypothetical protein [Deltaproteobacteria bacterium]